MSEETEYIWGRSRSKKAKYVHLYINGEAACGQGPRMDLQNENWTSEDPQTCPHCKEYEAWLKKGFHRVPSGDPESKI